MGKITKYFFENLLGFQYWCINEKWFFFYCILCLGSQIVHEKAPFVKSVLIAGPRGTGKKMLVHAICSETGANLFDLTATNIVGKYPGKAGLNMMLHMVFKVMIHFEDFIL